MDLMCNPVVTLVQSGSCSMHRSTLAKTLFAAALSLGATISTYAQNPESSDLRLAIQPVLSESRTRVAFAPLASYLQKVTGRKVVIETMPNFLSYWALPGSTYEPTDTRHRQRAA